MGFGKVDFEKDSERALGDHNLSNALVNVTDRFRSARKSASEQVANWDELRNRARAIKRETISNLDKYLIELEESVKRAGGHVHWALDSFEASEIIVRLAKEKNVKSIVKSKSMATEEIELNRSFEAAGLKVVETDLGEYIIQLAGEHPSHIIAPAIHKTKDDISELFSRKLDVPIYDEPEELTKVARERLRSEFLGADMGVSGANFAVAETGTIVVVENEGNARLTTTLPRIHVALVGIEKLIPKYRDLSLFLSVLARSATGQKSSTYVSFITGPRREGEMDGPEEFHLVLLDNGRSDIATNPKTRESLYCIRCGACLNNCPVYRQVGGHSYGWVYSGPIGAIINPQLMGIHQAPELPYASSLCGACKDVCPVKIDFPKLLLELRHSVVGNEIAKGSVGGKTERMMFRVWGWVMGSQFVYEIANRLGYYLQYLIPKGQGGAMRFPYPLARWTEQRDFPKIAKRSFRKRWRESRGAKDNG